MSPLLREIRRSLRSCLQMSPSSQTHSPAPRAGRWAAGWTRPWGEPSRTWTSSSWKALGRRSRRMSYSQCRDLRVDRSRWVWTGPSPGSPQSVGGYSWLNPTWDRRRIPETFQDHGTSALPAQDPGMLEREPSIKARACLTGSV